MNKLEESTRPDGRHYAPQYICSNLKAIKSWAEWNRKKITKKIKIRDENGTPTLEDEEVPSKQDLAKVLYSPNTNSRTRASISIIALAGCRPEVQGNRNGNDGLRIEDIPDLKIVEEEGKQIEAVFEKIPARIIVRASLSKTRRQYFTYMPEEGCEILKTYVDERIASGEHVTSVSALISVQEDGRRRIMSLYNIEDKSSFLATGTISKHIRKAMRASGLTQRPYVWRSYFDTRLMHAESEKLVTHSYVQFWMGHKGDIERTYTLNKQKLPEDVMEGIWQAAKRVQGIVQSRTPEEDIVTVEEAKAIGKETWFISLGFSKDEIQKLDLNHKEGEDLQNAMRKKLLCLLSENGRRQKIIRVEQIDSALEEGYEYVDKLPDGRIVVRLPEF